MRVEVYSFKCTPGGRPAPRIKQAGGGSPSAARTGKFHSAPMCFRKSVFKTLFPETYGFAQMLLRKTLEGEAHADFLADAALVIGRAELDDSNACRPASGRGHADIQMDVRGQIGRASCRERV